jgi:phage shock protein PspC (stress-responsive transcriptional regulator)
MTTNETNTPDGSRPDNPLLRSADDRMIGGVAAGIARCLDLDVALVRIAFVLLAVVGGSGVALYLAAWIVIPDEVTGGSLAGELLDRLGPSGQRSDVR